jgi:hypothetical protein
MCSSPSTCLRCVIYYPKKADMKSDGVSPALLFSLQKTHTRATCLRLSRLLSSKAYKPSFMCGVFVVQNVKCLLAIRRGDLSFMYKYCHLSTSSPSSTLRAVVIKNRCLLRMCGAVVALKYLTRLVMRRCLDSGTCMSVRCSSSASTYPHVKTSTLVFYAVLVLSQKRTLNP